MNTSVTLIPRFQEHSPRTEYASAAPKAYAPLAPNVSMPHLDELIGIVWRRISWVIGSTVVTVLLGLVLAMSADELYPSNAELLLNPNALRIVDNDLLQNSGTADIQNMQIESELHVLRSDSTYGAVVDRLGLENHPSFGAPPPGLRSRLLGSGGPVANRRRIAIERLTESVGIHRIQGSFVVEVYVRTGDAQLSADIANTIVQVYLEERLDVRSDKASRVTSDLQRRIDALREQLLESERAVETFKAANNLSASGGDLLSNQQLLATNQELNTARARSATARAVLDQIERAQSSGNLDTVVEAVRSQAVSQLRTQQADLKRQFAERSATLGPSHPQLISLRGQITEIDQLVANELDRIAKAARSDLERAEASETLLAHQVRELEKSSFETNETLLKLRELEREAQSRRSVYENFLARSQQLEGQKDLDSTEARVIVDAVPALQPQKPSSILVLAGSLIFGVGLGAGLAVVRELLDPHYGTAAHLSRALQLPIIADLNEAANDRQNADAARTALAKLIAHLQGGPLRQRPKIIAVISPQQSDARPHFVLEIMDVAVDSRMMTMVVDGDPAERRLSASAQMDGPLGFAEVVKRLGHQRLGSAFADSASSQWMLPLTEGSGVTLAAFDGASIARALRRMGHETDFIFIDGGVPQSPKSLPALLDAADHIVILADPQKTRRPEMLDLLQAMTDNYGKCLGLVTHDHRFAA